jgi:hypothetical protein
LIPLHLVQKLEGVARRVVVGGHVEESGAGHDAEEEQAHGADCRQLVQAALIEVVIPVQTRRCVSDDEAEKALGGKRRSVQAHEADC